IKGIAPPPPTHTQHANAFSINIWQSYCIIDNTANILYALCRIFYPTRLPTRFSLETGVISENDIAFFSQCLAIDIARRLLLTTAKRMDADNRRILF
ncbi:hypothetical protein EC990672_2091B, partial [Escherichia coli 99.0672]